MELFDPNKKTVIAKTFLDIFKIMIAAGLASKFFAEFQIPLRYALLLFAVLCFILGWLVYPSKKEETPDV